MPTLPPSPDSDPADRPDTPPLLPTPPQYRRQLGPVYWPWSPARRATPSLRVGDSVGRVTVTGEFWIPTRYARRQTDRWLELTCGCGRAAAFVTRAHNVTRNGRRLACRGCVLARGGYPTGPEHHHWAGCGGLSGSHLCAMRGDARRRGLPVTLTDIELAAQFAAQGGRCAYSGIPLTSAVDHADRTASLERLDNARPYEAGNVVVVHKTLNIMRRVLPLAHMVAIAEAVAAYDGIPRVASPACTEDTTPPAPPVLLARLGCRRDARGKSRGYGRYRCGRCGAEFVARVENVASGNTQSCGCYGAAARGQRTRRDAARHGPIRATYLRALARLAHKRGRRLEVSPEYLRDLFLAQRGCCALTGWPLSTRGRRDLASLDRIDSNGGYEAGNVQWVAPAVNLMKHRLSVADFVTWCVLIAAHLGRRWTDRSAPPTAAELTVWAQAAGHAPPAGPDAQR